jgi:hypothetical protein
MIVAEVPLQYAGETSTFAGKIQLTTAGTFEVEVLAMDPANANFGLDRRQLEVTP